MLPCIAAMWAITVLFEKPLLSVGLNLLFVIPGVLVANTPLWIVYPYCYSGYLVSCSLHDFTAETSDAAFSMFPFLPCAIVVFGLFFALAVTQFGKKEISQYRRAHCEHIATGSSCPVTPAFFAVGRNPNRLGRSQYRFCPAGSDPFSVMCAEQGKPQHYQYRIHSDQRFWGTADGGNHCTCLVPYFRSMRKRLCVKLEKLLDAV